jgi:hypothetical protein
MLSEGTILRLASGVWITEGPKVSVLLVDRSYVRLPNRVVGILARLGASPSGMTWVEAVRFGLTGEELDSLLAKAVVVVDPLESRRPLLYDVVTISTRLLSSRVAVASRGWAAVEPYLASPSTGYVPISRPLRFDEIEAAARLSRGLPGTATRCIEMSLALCTHLRAAGFASRVSLRVSASHTGMHAQAQVGDHVIDPNDWRTEAPEMTRFS